MLVGALGLMVGTGGSALVSKTMGEGDPARASAVFSMLIRFTVILSLVFMEPLARLLGAEGETVRLCVVYGSICTLGLPTYMLQLCFQSFYMTAERPQLGTVMSLVGAGTNMVLDALFIEVFKWGLAGAAAATTLASCVSGIFPLWYFSGRRNRSSLRLVRARSEREPLLQACSNGLSEYVGNITWNVLAICYNLQLLRMMGEAGVAAYAVLLYYGYIFAAVFFGFNISVTPIIGYNYGSGNRAELKSLLRHSVTLLLVLGALMTLVSELSAGPAARLFVGYDPELTALTKHAIRLYMLSFFIAGFNLFISAWFTGLGNGKVSAAVSFIRNLVFAWASPSSWPTASATAIEPSVQFHCRAGGGDHQHAAVLAKHFVIEVDADHGVGAEPPGAVFHFLHGLRAGRDEFFFVRAAAAADDVADARSEIADEVHAGDHLSEDDAFILGDGPAFDGRGGRKDHNSKNQSNCCQR